MKSLKTLLFSFALLALAAAARAEDFRIAGVGTLSLQVPAGWSVTQQSQGNVSALVFTPQNKAVNAQAFLAISTSTNALSPATEGRKFAAICQQFLPKSVEKKISAQPYKLAQGQGTYAVFTDASLVGKPAQPGNYKVVAPGLVQLNDFTEVFALLGADDAGGPEMSALRAAVESLRLAPPGPATVIDASKP